MQRECPNCMEKWASKEARWASGRMWMGSKMRAREQMWYWRSCRVLHVMISIPDTGQGLEASRIEAREIAKRHNLDGGLMIYHPFREENGVFVRDGFIHYHLIALAHGNVPQGGTDGDIIFKVIQDAENDDYRGFRDPKGIKRAVHYLLSHCGILKGRHALTWWGSLSYNKLPDKTLKENYPDAYREMHEPPPHLCPYCGSADVVCAMFIRFVDGDRGCPSHEPLHHWGRS